MCHNQNKSLQQPVRAIAVAVAGITLLVGISSIVHGGDLEWSIGGLVVNLSITGVLFYGAKRKDTTHLVLWLVFSLIQIIGLFIGMCYFAYEAKQLLAMYKSAYRKETVNKDMVEGIWKLRMTYIVYSLIMGVLIMILFSISIVVKKFYDELQRSETYQPYGK